MNWYLVYAQDTWLGQAIEPSGNCPAKHDPPSMPNLFKRQSINSRGSTRCVLMVMWLCLSLVVLGGCDDHSDEIQVYNAPSPDPVPEKVAKASNQAGPGGPGLGGGPSAELKSKIKYDLPDGWHEAKSSSRMRLVNLKITADKREGELSITRFPGQVGSTLANVNRWRGQVDLPAVQSTDELGDKTLRKLPFDGLPCTIYDIGPAKDKPEARRIVVAAIHDAKSKWFIKMDGPNALVDSQLDAFSRFMQNLQLPLDRPAASRR